MPEYTTLGELRLKDVRNEIAPVTTFQRIAKVADAMKESAVIDEGASRDEIIGAATLIVMQLLKMRREGIG